MAFEAEWLSARLNYEILNVSIPAIANTMGLTLEMVTTKADAEEWHQWFPEDEDEFHLDEDLDINEGENLFELKANQFTSSGKKRLQVYQIAKQLHLMGLYTKLEVNLLDKANSAVHEIEPAQIEAIAQLSTVLQNLTKDLSKMAQSMTLSSDENGLPQLIIRDLSGSPT